MAVVLVVIVTKMIIVIVVVVAVVVVMNVTYCTLQYYFKFLLLLNLLSEIQKYFSTIFMRYTLFVKKH